MSVALREDLMRIFVSFFSLLSLAVFFTACGGVSIEEGSHYCIMSKSGETCFDVPQGNRAAGVGIILWAANSVSNAVPNQNWMFRKAGDGYKIVSVLSELCLDVASGSDANGARIIQWSDTGPDADNQIFLLEPAGEYVRIISQRSKKLLGTVDGTLNPGAVIAQFEAQPERADSQLWMLKKIK